MKNKQLLCFVVLTTISIILILSGCNQNVKSSKLNNLDIFKSASMGQPAYFLFRHPESFVKNYENWIDLFGKADGILAYYGREIPNADIRLEVYNRYKDENPGKFFVAHYDGMERDPRELEGQYFPGHWLYYRGCTALEDIPAQSGSTTIKVENTSFYMLNWGLNKDRNEDIILVAKGKDGKPDWYNSEEVILESIDKPAGTIKVKRGQYGTASKEFKASEVFVLPHVTGGPWIKDGNLLWSFNFSVDCPRDNSGKRALDILAEEISGFFKRGGKYEKFDGIEFDASFTEFYNYNDCNRGIDTNGDLIPDWGLFDGRNKFGEGFVEFLTKLRNMLGNDKLIMSDGNAFYEQRAVGTLNGIESEGFIDSLFRDFEWSWGINRHNFWSKNSFKGSPKFSYINHKYKAESKGMNIDRMSFAAALFTDSFLGAINLPFQRANAEWITLGMPIWDEWIAGTENRPGWLGAPLSPTISLSKQGKNLLDNVSYCNDIDYLFPSADTYTGKTYTDMNYGILPVLSLNSGNTIYIKFNVPAGIGSDIKALLQFQVTSIMGVATDPSAQNTIRLFKSDESGWDEDVITSINYSDIPLRDTGQSVNVSNIFWKKGVNFDVTGLLPKDGGNVTFCIKADNGSRYTLSSKEGMATPKIILASKISNKNNDMKILADPGKGEVTANGFTGGQRIRNHIIFSTDWFKSDGRDLTVFMNIEAEGGTLLEDRARLIQIRAVDREGMIYGEGNNLSWINGNNFEASFYFDNIIPDSEIRLEFEAEGAGEIRFSNIAAYAFPDIKYREYEGGVVIANPSLISGFIFDLSKYLPNRSFKRINATQLQDKTVNNGKPIEDGKVTLGSYDAIFLLKSD